MRGRAEVKVKPLSLMRDDIMDQYSGADCDNGASMRKGWRLPRNSRSQ
jgi:hypothetical protein